MVDYVDELLRKAGLVAGRTQLDNALLRKHFTQEDAKEYLAMIGPGVPESGVKLLVLEYMARKEDELILKEAARRMRSEIQVGIFRQNVELHERWKARYQKAADPGSRFGVA